MQFTLKQNMGESPFNGAAITLSEARGRNGWFVPAEVYVSSSSVHSSVSLRVYSRQHGKSAPIIWTDEKTAMINNLEAILNHLKTL